MVRLTRPISWLKAARKDFAKFSVDAQSNRFDTLTIAADGGKWENAKPLNGLGSGVFEIVLPHKGDAFRVVHAVQIDDHLWVIHAFQKKSKQGTQTLMPEIELVKQRLKRLKEELK